MKTKQRALSPMEDSRLKQIRGYFESASFKNEMRKVIPEYLTPERLTRIALTEFRKNPELLKCTPESLLNSVMDCAQMGLEPSTAYNHVYLIPYGTECTAQISSLGYKHILRRNGIHLISEVVYEEDEFSYEYTPDLKFRFVPSLKKRETKMGVFSLAKVPTDQGYVYYMVYLSKDQVNAIRLASPGQSHAMSPWNKFTTDMWCKSADKKLSKILASISNKIAEVMSVEEGDAHAVSEDVLKNSMDITPDLVEEPQSKADSLADMIENNNMDEGNESSS